MLDNFVCFNVNFSKKYNDHYDTWYYDIPYFKKSIFQMKTQCQKVKNWKTNVRYFKISEASSEIGSNKTKSSTSFQQFQHI